MRILSSLVNGMFTNNQWLQKCIVFAFAVISLICCKITNRHEKLNRLMIAQTPLLFLAKNY